MLGVRELCWSQDSAETSAVRIKEPLLKPPTSCPCLYWVLLNSQQTCPGQGILSSQSNIPAIESLLLPLCFYQRPTLVPVFANQNISQKDFHFYEMVIVFLLFPISTKKRRLGNTLLLNTRSNLYYKVQ